MMSEQEVVQARGRTSLVGHGRAASCRALPAPVSYVPVANLRNLRKENETGKRCAAKQGLSFSHYVESLIYANSLHNELVNKC